MSRPAAPPGSPRRLGALSTAQLRALLQDEPRLQRAARLSRKVRPGPGGRGRRPAAGQGRAVRRSLRRGCPAAQGGAARGPGIGTAGPGVSAAPVLILTPVIPRAPGEPQSPPAGRGNLRPAARPRLRGAPGAEASGHQTHGHQTPSAASPRSDEAPALRPPSSPVSFPAAGMSPALSRLRCGNGLRLLWNRSRPDFSVFPRWPRVQAVCAQRGEGACPFRDIHVLCERFPCRGAGQPALRSPRSGLARLQPLHSPGMHPLSRHSRGIETV